MCIHIRIKPFILYWRELANNLQHIIKPFPLDFPSNIKIVLQGYKLPSHHTLVLLIKTKNWAAMAFSRRHTHQSLPLDPDPFQVLAFNKSFTFTAICTAFKSCSCRHSVIWKGAAHPGKTFPERMVKCITMKNAC